MVIRDIGGTILSIEGIPEVNRVILTTSQETTNQDRIISVVWASVIIKCMTLLPASLWLPGIHLWIPREIIYGLPNGNHQGWSLVGKGGKKKTKHDTQLS